MKGEIKIDKDIPIPLSIEMEYPLQKLQIGNSFFVDRKQIVYFYQKAKKLKIKIKARQEKEGYRIWRIA